MAQITDVKIFPVKGHKTVKANGYLTLDEEFKVKFSLLEGKNGLFVTFPADKYTDKEGKDAYSRHFEPTGKNQKDVQKRLNDTVIAAYRKFTGGLTQPSSPEPVVQQDSSLVPF
jgi:DNA-binding cell septation regulator SpoVG